MWAIRDCMRTMMVQILMFYLKLLRVAKAEAARYESKR